MQKVSGREVSLSSLVELRELSEIELNKRNARKHSPDQIGQIAGMIREVGWTVPILIDEDQTVIAGHGRVAAAGLLYEDGEAIRLPNGGGALPLGKVPVIVARGWSEAQRRAYAIADNRLAEIAEWDEDLLRIEIGGLLAGDAEDLGVGVLGIGFTELEIDQLLAEAGMGNDPEAEWQGMPEFDQQDKTAFRTIHVHFKNSEDVKRFSELIGQKITEKTRFVWYPMGEIERYADKRYVSDDP